MADNASEGTPEVDRPVRIDEVHKFHNALLEANSKRTYDEYQNDSLRQVRQIDKQMDDMHTIRTQILSSMAENANLAAKKSLDHWDKSETVAGANAGAAADAAIDQSPPDEGVRQAKEK